MAKRFTDTDKWRKGWFSDLTPEMKLLWIYILDNCDSSGVWDINFKLAEFQIGLPLNIENIKEVFKKQYIEINNSKWFIRDFIEFQYKCSIDELNPLNKAHIPVIAIVKKYNLKGAYKGLTRGLQAPQDKDKDKDKDKGKGFEVIWLKYPNKVGKKEALKHYHASIKTEEDIILINRALENYLKSERVAKGFIQNASTWFNDWKTWLEYKEEICPKCKGSGIWTSQTGYENICSCSAGVRKRGKT